MIRAAKRKTNGGGTKPYKQTVFSRFVDWIALPLEERKKIGVDNQTAFAKKYGVRNATLTDWKKREDFDAKKRSRYLEGLINIDPHDYDLLLKFVTDHGKIMPARLTGATAKQQRQIKHAVRRARVMGLLP